METHGNSQHDPDDARRMLDAAQQAEQQTKNPPLPWVFFILQAVLLAGICAAQLLPVNAARTVTIIGVLAIVAVGTRWVFYRPGYGAVMPDMPGAFPYLLAMLIAVGVPAILAMELGLVWMWLIAALLAALITLEMGRRYRRAVGRG